MSESVFYKFPSDEVLELKYFDYQIPATLSETREDLKGAIVCYRSGGENWIPVGGPDSMMKLFQIFKDFISLREFIYWNNQQIDRI